MIIYGLMKFVEQVPERYDKVMNVLTLGNHSRSHQIMLDHIKPGMKVLDIGCGTGNMAIKCAKAGAKVTGIDASLEMLRLFKSKIAGTPEEQNITIVECGAGSLTEVLGNERFDLIIASLMLGELPSIIRKKTIHGAAELLKDDGTFLINDELWPENPVVSAIYHLLFWLFFVPNFLLTRTLIRPVRNLHDDLKHARLVISDHTKLFGGVMSILKISKECEG